jgi:hypothetical protein
MKPSEIKKQNAEWLNAQHERDNNGNLTPLAMALNAISDYGCDCGDDEPGTCLTCLCENALKDMYRKLHENEKS